MLKTGEMIETSDIAKAFCDDIGRQLRHPKCTTFFMSPEQVYEKLEAMCEKTYEAADGHEKMEFNDALLWEIVALVKRGSPQLLQHDNSITNKAKDCTLCQKKLGRHVYKEHLLCQDCYQMVLDFEGDDNTEPKRLQLQCKFCQSTEDLVAHLNEIYCPSCRKTLRSITPS